MAKATSWMGRVPAASGTGPKNLPKTTADAFRSVARAGRAGVRRPASPRTGTSRASAGYGPPPGGAAGGIPRSTTPMASANPRNVTKAKSSMQNRGQRLGQSRADFPSKI